MEPIPKMMKAARKASPMPGFDIVQVPVPKVGPGEALVRVRATSICGTDLHIYKWDPWAQGRVKPPIIQGHELCGDVVEVGSGVTDVNIGDFVSAESHVVCGRCDMCRTGRGHICRSTKILGVDRDGSFAEYVSVPAQNLWLESRDLSPKIAVLMENFGNAVHAAFKTDVRARKVLVTGCGPAGCMAVAVLKAIGARAVYASDVSQYRADLAKRMGADRVIVPPRENLAQILEQETQGEGVDVLLEMSGAPSAITDGLRLLKPGCEAVLFGLPSAPVSFDLSNLVIFKGVTVHGVVGRVLWENWYQARGLLRSGAVDLSPIVTHSFGLDDAHKGFEIMASGQSGKIAFFPQGVPASER
ncbi:MAG: L-threonine 3-dehydrogenase [Thermoplasmatota archaeon]